MAKSKNSPGSSKSHHVVPSPDGGWNIKKAGADKASKHFSTKDEAVKHGRAISQNQRTELYIHRKDGTIERKASHGADPHPPKDRDTNKK